MRYGLTKEKPAENLKAEISKAIVSYKKETSVQTLVNQGLLALLVIVVVSLIIYGNNHLFEWMRAKTITKDAWYTRGIKIKGFELLNGNRQLKLLHSLINVVKWLVIFLVVYLALPVLFSIFPFTRDISNTMLGYVISPLKRIAIAAWDYIPNLITIIIVVVIFRYILKFFRFIKLEIEEGRLSLTGFLCRLSQSNLPDIKGADLSIYACYHLSAFTGFRLRHFQRHIRVYWRPVYFWVSRCPGKYCCGISADLYEGI